MWFFVFSINFARTLEGRPARRKLTELLVKSKKYLFTDPAAIFFVFQLNISCKTTSIILYFKYASFSVVTRKKRQNTNPHPDGNFFGDRFGLGILRDDYHHILDSGGSDELVSSANPSSPAIVTSRQEKRANAKTLRKWRRCLWRNSISSSCFPCSFQLQMVLCLNTNQQS